MPSLEEKRDFAARMRQRPTPAEALLWARLKRRQLGFQFQRQGLVYGFIVDFWCPAVRLAIEVDGSVHQIPERAIRDDDKDHILERNEIGVLRFTNDEVDGMLEMVLDNITRELRFRHQLLFKGFAFPYPWISSSSRRRCASVDNSAVARTIKTLAASLHVEDPPPDQRMTAEDADTISKRLRKVVAKSTAMFYQDKRPVSEKVWEQRYRLAEYLQRKNA